MKTTIIYDHPFDGSLNHEILKRISKKLEHEQKEYAVIDFHKDEFNPVMSVEELALYSQGQTTREDVKKYQKLIQESDELIFIFPIWWYNMPANTKGWIDLVFKSGVAYTYENNVFKPLLNTIKKATIYTTSGATTQELIEEGDPINGILIKGTLNAVGIENCEWINFELMGTVSRDEITKQLNKISQ